MLTFPDPNVETEYTDPNGSVWAFNGTGWVRQPDCSDGGGGIVAAPYVEFLLNGDDAADGSQDIFDASGRHDITIYGDVYISTAEKKHGTGSLDFTKGNGYVSIGYNPSITLNQNINVPYTRSFAGGDVFTIEGWFYTNGTANGVIVADERPRSTTHKLNRGWHIFHGNGALRWIRSNNGYDSAQSLITSGIQVGQWHHFAAAWDGSAYRLFVDGVLGATVDSDIPIMSANTCSMTVGAQLNAANPDNYTSVANPLDGYIDDLMVTIGVCKYTADFTPPEQIQTSSFTRKRKGAFAIDVELEVGDFQDDSEPLGDDE